MAKKFFLILMVIVLSKAQQIKYLQALFENDVCEGHDEIHGTCQKISNCSNEYENYRNNKSILKICHYHQNDLDTLICCPEQPKNFVPTSINLNGKPDSQAVKKLDIFDFETCREEFLPYRKLYTNNQHFAQAMRNNILPLNDENCKILSNLNEINSDRLYGETQCFKGNLFQEVTIEPTIYGFTVKKGDRPNMAANGLMKNHETFYVCGGSIITSRFIVTAAHCKFHNGEQVNTVRVGDRYLITKEDDDIAQQLNIEHFILHHNYNSFIKYNDIAMIKTVENIEFNKFVVPSCIDDLDSPRIGVLNELTVAGYGRTEHGVQSNILLEIKARIISNSECNKTYQESPDLPNGILDSQFCVESFDLDIIRIQDTCYGDSGSPLQFKTDYEIFPEDFNTTYLSKVYISSTVLGIVSFGIGCGLKAPSVYTKLYYFRDWMRDVIENN